MKKRSDRGLRLLRTYAPGSSAVRRGSSNRPRADGVGRFAIHRPEPAERCAQNKKMALRLVVVHKSRPPDGRRKRASDSNLTGREAWRAPTRLVLQKVGA